MQIFHEHIKSNNASHSTGAVTEVFAIVERRGSTIGVPLMAMRNGDTFRHYGKVHRMDDLYTVDVELHDSQPFRIASPPSVETISLGSEPDSGVEHTPLERSIYDLVNLRSGCLHFSTAKDQ